MSISQFPPVSGGGIPTGDTAGRPASPVIGDVYYNGQTGILEIYSGTEWVPCSAPPGTPSLVAQDVGTSRAYGSGGISFTFTASLLGGSPLGYIGIASIGATSYTTGTTTATTTTLTVGNNGTYNVSAIAYNGFGSSSASIPVNLDVTTVPQTPTIGTATISGTTTDVTVSWTLGSNGGKNLTAVTITPYLNGTTAQTSRTAATTSSTSYTFTGATALTSGSSYTFRVKATNANGDSLESNATASITVPTIFNIEGLVVAGGGGGSSGGGGAGGFRTFTARATATGANYNVTVGAGGAAATKGGNSTYDNFSSTGGGRGGEHASIGGAGGSGGGTGRDGNNTSVFGQGNEGNYSPSEGNRGGGAEFPSWCGGGGGGGASAAGGNGIGGGPTTERGGAGGAGSASSITGTSVTYAGGGGGRNDGNSNQATGGAGGGGAGGTTTVASGGNGTANTGGGGGGGSTGGTGGSGIVVLRYPNTRTITVGAGLTAGVTNQSVGTNERYTTLTAGTGTVSWS